MLVVRRELPMTVNKHTPIYIAPANPAGKTLADRLQQHGYNIAGMADNLKQGQNIINNVAQAQPNAIVVIAAGSFLHTVAAGLRLRGFNKSQLWTTDSNHRVKNIPATTFLSLQTSRNGNPGG